MRRWVFLLIFLLGGSTAFSDEPFRPGDFVYSVVFRRGAPSRVFAYVVLGEEGEQLRVAPIRTGKNGRLIKKERLTPLELRRGATEFECQQEFLAELSRHGCRSARTRALKFVLEQNFSGNERTRFILQLLKVLDALEIEQKTKCRELENVMHEIRQDPEGENRRQLDSRAEVLQSDLALFGGEMDKLVAEAINRQDFWLAVIFADQLDQLIQKILRGPGRHLQKSDQDDLRQAIQTRSEAILKALGKRWQDPERKKAAERLPDSGKRWIGRAPRSRAEAVAAVRSSVNAWRELAELSMLAEPDLWCAAAMEVVLLLPRNCGKKELRDPLKRELDALPVPAAPERKDDENG